MIPDGAFLQSGLDWETAYALVLSSRLAYKTPDIVERVVTQHWGFDECRFLEVGENQGFVAAKPDAVVIAFRGTDSISDWLSNVNLLSTKRDYGKVHKGFVEAYLALHDEVLAALADWQVANTRTWLTGHSLGGAMAAIAGVELRQHANLAGCMTFGQPRTGDSRFARSLGEQLPGACFRFVNNDDLVTKVPPGYSHAGTLIHFDASGQLVQAEATEAWVESSLEPQPLSMERFTELQNDARAIVNAARDPASEGLLGEGEIALDAADRSLEGLWTGVVDHEIDRYVGAVRRQLGGAAVEPAVISESEARSVLALSDEAVAEVEAFGAPGAAPQPAPSVSVPVLLRLKDTRKTWDPPAGMTIYSKVGSFCTGSATAEQIEALQGDDNVVSVSASRQGGILDCTDAVEYVNGCAVQRPPIDERGDRALIGVIDTGLDVLHEAFLKEDPAGGAPHTRVRAYWDQRDPTGPTPHAMNPSVFPDLGFDRGTYYEAAQIDQMLAGAIPTPAPLRDQHRHGTFVASIAAGRQVGAAANEFQGGMAPEAGICVVRADIQADDQDPNSLGYSVSHIAAVHFLKLYAESVGMPIAVNMSLGMNAGAHDGQSALEGSFDALSGQGRDPGFVIVKSAGNEHNKGGHAEVQAATGICEVVSWRSGPLARSVDYFEVWYDGLDDLEFILKDPSGASIGPVNEQNPSLHAPMSGNDCRLDLVVNHPDNGDNLLTITISKAANTIQTGDWELEIVGRDVMTEGRVDVWVERNNRRPVSFVRGVSERVTLSIPGTADTVISVANCNMATPIRLADSSSRGPTRVGGAKPDFSAPGDNVEGALANSADHRANDKSTGTSFSAPLVTGAIALLFSRRAKEIEADPSLRQVNAQQVRTAMRRSAKFPRVLHHTGFGHGVLDAAAFLQEF